MITLILAVAANGVIGRDGAIPWHIPEDLKRFKALTLGKTVVMGRKTWDSLPRKPLPGRRNIVVTRQAGWQADGAERMPLDGALNLPGEVFVIGGAEIYRAALPRADRIELTEIDADFAGNAVFRFDRAGWRSLDSAAHVTAEGLAYRFVTLAR